MIEALVGAASKAAETVAKVGEVAKDVGKEMFDPRKALDSAGVDFKDMKNGRIDAFDPKKPLDVRSVPLESNMEYTFDGNKNYTDDNGEIYCVDNELIPNNSYELNGYKYDTDDCGRIVSAEGNLQIKDHEGREKINVSKTDIGKGDERDTDDKGHIIGDQFNGAGGLGNLVMQDCTVNRSGDYWKLENQLAKEVKDGKEVFINIDLDYPGKSFRPDGFMVTYFIDGEEFVKVISNNPGGEEK
jgi:hypothetical protein